METSNTTVSKGVEGLEQELIEDIEGLASQYLDNRTDLVQVRTKLEQVQEEQGRAEEGQKSQKFKAQLWLCEDYPLSLQEQVMPIVDLLAISNTHFKKLKDFIHMQLPSGFPVKIGNEIQLD